LLHAAGEYLTLAYALRQHPLGGQVLNLTPVFLEQLLAYAENRVHDPLLDALATPAADLPPESLQELVRWAFLQHPRRLARLRRLAALEEKVRGAKEEELPRRLTVSEITDLQVLAVLAHAFPNARWEETIRQLLAKGASFSQQDRQELVAWLRACPGKLLTLYRELAEAGVEIATSPYAHPLLPLLLDTQVAAASVPPPPGGFPRFSSPSDAHAHITKAQAFMAQLGFQVVGFWPPEGALSPEAVALYGQHGVGWLATDEGLLAASLGHPVAGETGTSWELTCPWQLSGTQPVIFFRHRGLSDFLGFKAQEEPEEQAAQSFLQLLAGQLPGLPEEGGLLVALDGENPWTSYPEGGATFLPALFAALQLQGRWRLVTLRQRLEEEKPRSLPRLHPGSWIGASFATWIGHEEKCKAWELLALCHQAGAQGGGESWLAAQGSDWWWWFGDDNPTPLAPLYDRLFRWHLADALRAADRRPIPQLAVPVRRGETPLLVPLSRTWPVPVLDGRSTSYFEWAVAQWVEAAGFRLALRGDGEHLWLRLDPPSGQPVPLPVAVTLASGTDVVRYQLPADQPGGCAVGKILEAALPASAGNLLLVVEVPGQRLPAWGSYRLQFLEVDEP
jgi:alpha-amylase/alpha-mannosidase (GH57 family)